MSSFQVAVITPFHAEPWEYLERARQSVRRQTWPYVWHVLVGDGSTLRPVEDEQTLCVHLPRGCRDFGDTPRALGALYAAGLGVDAVAFLDADNWYQPGHIESLVRMHHETGAHVVSSRRAFHRIDGTYMAECTASDGQQFADTNCLFLVRAAFGLLNRWVLMDPRWHGIDDRVFWDHVQQTGTSTAHTGHATAAYRGQFMGLYWDLKEPVPQGARKPDDVRAALESWHGATGRSLKVNWGYRRYLEPGKVIDIYALTIKEQGAVSLTRVQRPLQSLANTGAVRATAGTQLSLPQMARPGVLVLHRHFLSDPSMLQQVNGLAERGWLVISDIDDDPHHWPGYVDSRMVAFRGVHAVTVSTEHLAGLVGQWNPEVTVFQNMLDDLSPALIEKRSRVLSQAAQGESRSKVDTIRVFFGAFNRQHDAQALLEGLTILSEDVRRRLHWVVLHDRAFHDALPLGFSREFHPTCSWAPYMKLLSSCDVAVLPLNDTAFNRFKSDLKLVEALAAGAVPICSPVVYQEVHGHAPYVRWAATPADWAERLANALSEPEAWERARVQGYQYVHEHRLQWHQDAHRMATYRQWMADLPRLEAERQVRMRNWRAEVA
jgi:hypothetical protein